MRNTILTVMAILCLAVTTHAENPDSRPSIWLGVGGSTSSGEYEILEKTQDLENKDIDFSCGLKLPVSENVSIWGSFNYSDSHSKHEKTITFLRV